MIKKIPFLPMKIEHAKKWAKVLIPISFKLQKFKPGLKADLVQIEAELDPPTYISLALLSGMFAFTFIFVLCLVLCLATAPGMLLLLFPVLLLSSIVFSFVIFFRNLLYPSLLLKRKARELNKDLMFALRHMLIQIKSGITLYNAMVSVSEAGYGIVSEEFGKVAKEIEGGISQIDALENMVVRTPSVYLRRAIWQISNALKSGFNVADILEILVKEFAAEERIRIQRFSRELSPWALMYMLLIVVFPTMGIAMFLILSTLTPIAITPPLFVAIGGVFVIFQFFFIKLLKSKRPVLHF